MKPTRSELFFRRRADADRLAECFARGSISDVLAELDQEVWQGPDKPDWKSSLPSPDVPVDAITSLGVTLLGEALLVPREYEFRLALVCLLLERGAQPCRCTANGRAIEAVLEQLLPSQQEGDYLWYLRHVVDIAVDCRLNREHFLISQHAPFVADWINEQLALLEQLENAAETAAITELDPAEDATAVEFEPTLNLNRRSESPLRDYDDLPDYEDVDTEMAEQAAPSMSGNNAGRDADAGQPPAEAPQQSSSLVPSSSSSTELPVLQPAAQVPASVSSQSQSTLPHSPQYPPHSTEETPTRTASPSSTPGPSGDSSTGRASRLPASVLSRSRIRVRTRPTPSASVDPETPKRAEVVPALQPNGATTSAVAAAPKPPTSASNPVSASHESTTSAPASATTSMRTDLPRSFWLHGVPDVTPYVLKHYLSSGPTTFLTAAPRDVPFLQTFVELGSFPAQFAAGAPLPPLPVEVRMLELTERRSVFEYGPRLGHVVYASGEAAEKAREMFDGQRMFPEEIPGTEKIRWKEQGPKV